MNPRETKKERKKKRKRGGFQPHTGRWDGGSDSEDSRFDVPFEISPGAQAQA